MLNQPDPSALDDVGLTIDQPTLLCDVCGGEATEDFIDLDTEAYHWACLSKEPPVPRKE